MLFLILPIKAEEYTYYLAYTTENGYEIIDEFSRFSSANRQYRRNLDDYDNLIMLENDEIILMEYGVVEFKTSEGCVVNQPYEDLNINRDGFINPCYGVDAAYLYSANNTNRVYFMLGGTLGYTDRSNVILHPYDSLDVRVSRYTVTNGILYHEIKTQLESDFYAMVIPVCDAPEYLNEGESYFSYDGHYFYDNFKTMIDDYTNETRDSAVNGNTVFYNYYAYLPHRTLTNYNLEDLENYFTKTLFINRKLDNYSDDNQDGANDIVNRSQLYDELDAFIAYQNIYGANAMMMLSLSINESSYGKSLSAYNRNNLFGHAAYDNDVEREASRYLDASTSVYSHAKYYINDRYSNPLKTSYYGSFFGDKRSGMNVMYSSDPYWAEKVASYYYQLDKAMGYKDYNAYSIGIIENDKEITIYSNQSLHDSIITISDISPYSFVILEEFDGVYKIQYDDARESYYDFESDVAYIDKDLVDIVLNQEAISPKRYHTITFDAVLGDYDGESKVNLKVLDGQVPVMIKPDKDGYEFIKYNHEPKIASANDIYVAEYKQIESIEIIEYPINYAEYQGSLDLSNGRIRVNYFDGLYKEVDITTDMVSGFNPNELSKQTITISYCGVTTEYEIEVIDNGGNDFAKIKSNLETLLDTYKASGSYDIPTLETLVNQIDYIDSELNYEEIKLLDQMILELTDNKINYMIEDSRFDFNISGMALSLNSLNSLVDKHPFYKDTYKLALTVLNGYENKMMNALSEAYDFEKADSFALYFKKNGEDLSAKIPMIISFKLDDMDISKIYTVYQITSVGDIYKCRTTQSKDRIEIMAYGEGSFIVFAKQTTNEYTFEANEHNLNQNNDDEDYTANLLTITRIVLIVLVLAICIVYNKILKEKEKQIWNDYKKSLRNVECVQEEKQKN